MTSSVGFLQRVGLCNTRRLFGMLVMHELTAFQCYALIAINVL
jgi:hypothetical protein